MLKEEEIKLDSAGGECKEGSKEEDNSKEGKDYV